MPGIDCNLSPPKSVSVLLPFASPIDRAALEAAHLAAVRVTVAAIGADGKALATKVTNEVGRYGFALPAVPVSLTFSLEGFSTAAVNLEIPPDADVPVAAQRLALAPRSETVRRPSTPFALRTSCSARALVAG